MQLYLYLRISLDVVTNGKNNVKEDNVPSKDVDDLDLNKYVDVTRSAYVVHFCAGCRMHLWK